MIPTMFANKTRSTVPKRIRSGWNWWRAYAGLPAIGILFLLGFSLSAWADKGSDLPGHSGFEGTPVKPVTYNFTPTIIVNYAIAGSGASDEVEVLVTDASTGLPASNVSVTFTIQGTSISPSQQTDANGKTDFYVQGSAPGSTNIIIKVNGQTQTVTLTFIAGPPDVNSSGTYLQVDVPAAPADGTSKTTLHAHVEDGYGNVLSGLQVTFAIAGGTASGTAVTTPGTLQATTDGSGNATINITNLKAGTVQYTATVNSALIVNGSPATVTFTALTPSVSNPLTTLVVDVAQAAPDGTSTTKVHAHVVDVNGNVVPNATIVFSNNGGSASATAGFNPSSMMATTDAGGNATITITNTKAGTVQLTATVNGTAITNGSPATVTFVATTPDVTNSQTKLVVQTASAPADGTSAAVVYAHVVDANGNPVPNATVTYTISGGTASAAGTLSSITVTTDANGNATVDIYDTKAGTVQLTATVSTASMTAKAITNGSPATVTFVATNPDVTNAATALVVDVPQAAPDGTSTTVVHAHIVDANGNAVQGAAVSFTINGGTASATASVIVINATTDASGNAVINITNTRSGTVTLTATVSTATMTATAITNGSPATVTFVATTPDVTNPQTKLVVSVPTAPADGSTNTTVYAHVVDANGNPVPNAAVTFTISGGSASATAAVTPSTLTVTTDASGNAQITITNTKSGTVSFTAKVGGNAITNGSPATVTFTAITPDVTNSQTKLVVDVASAPADGTSTTQIHAHIVDASGNPVQNATVIFTINGGTASGTAAVTPSNLTVTTDANGNAQITITDTKSGTVTFTATVNGTAITNGSPATVTFTAITPDITNPSTSLIVDVAQAAPDGTSTTQIHAHVVDASGNPVQGATVTFTVSGGTASTTAVVAPGLSGTTDANGNVTITITNTKAGTVQFKAAVSTAAMAATSITNGSPATVTFVATTPDVTNSATALVVQVPSAPADGASVTVVYAHVVDANGNPVPNATVTFTISGGTASATASVTPSTLTVTTDANGNAQIMITNTNPGTVSFTAAVGGQAITHGSPATVMFTGTVPDVTNAQTQLVVDVASAPADGTSTTKIHAHIVDATGNPVQGATVVFTNSGGTATATASISPALTGTTDANGNVTITITNTKIGTVTFTATVSSATTPAAAITNGSPATVTFTVSNPSTTNPATTLVVDVATAPADGSTKTQIHAHVVDAGGNVIPGASVVFTISGGTALATASVTPSMTVTTDANGDATIYITNTKVGTVSFTATVGGSPITNGSPATVSFSSGNPAPTGGNTKLTVTLDNSVDNGTNTDNLQAQITDANGNPVQGASVTFTIEAGGTAGNTAAFNGTATVTTDANGIATIGVTNTAVGTVEIGAYVNGVAITGSPAEITFVNAPDVTNSQTQLVVITYEALADGKSTTQVKAHIVDVTGTPISGEEVIFKIDSGTAQIVTAGPWTTDANGDVYINISSSTVGAVLITATVNGQAITFGSPARVYFAGINIYVPKVFTPNNDGTNDVLKPILVGMSAFHYFNVYNRWGNLIYSTQDPNQGWDGTWKGIAQPVETYLWLSEGVDINGKKVVAKGTVSLVR